MKCELILGLKSVDLDGVFKKKNIFIDFFLFCRWINDDIFMLDKIVCKKRIFVNDIGFMIFCILCILLL